MQALIALFSAIAMFLLFKGVIFAQTFQVINDEWLWFSSNLQRTNLFAGTKSNNSIEHQDSRLGNFTYDKYFEQKGQPPAYNFLQLLTKDVRGARIDGKDIVFLKTGLRLALKTDLVPSGADQALPYLLEIPNTKIVCVVYPYYFYGCKENKHLVELYSEDGDLLHLFDSLPTHAVKKNPNLLISLNRSGCCDSLKWSIRFYNLSNGKVSKYECPEGACGDMLFLKLEKEGSFLVGLELIGFLSGVGAFLQTNIYIINDNGSLIASGKIIHAFRSPLIHKNNIRDISPFSITKLSSLKPITNNGSGMWFLEFQDKEFKTPLLLRGNNKDKTPAVVFLMPKEDDSKEIIEFNNKEIGPLPTIVICEPGNYEISGRKSKMMKRIKVQSEAINKIFF
ncbi:MAG: hypothetical protein JRH18_13625 [Deltaproteobacteria bacterium]|nr:hypothetical protein [Deltaproteobacteria bacterium]MBW2152695.1 hypothetical protein [Deltaproteobacteria bacterium]